MSTADLHVTSVRGQSIRVALFLTITTIVVALLLIVPARYSLARPAGQPVFVFLMFCFAFVSIDVALCLVTQVSLLLAFRRFGTRIGTVAAIQLDPMDPPLTAFVVPALLKDEATARRLIATLESHAKSNYTPGVYFGLLTDLSDASTQRLPTDIGLLEVALRGIDSLNEQPWVGVEPRFFLLHRDRNWSPAQGAWMGHERKRGKLNDLNDYIATGKLGRFTLARGAASSIVGARFVITLDEDNNLVTGGARLLIRHMNNHLHSLIIDRQKKVVLQGCGILQPLPLLPEDFVASTRFQRMLELCWSDAERLELVYEVLFREGSFVGKGIYSVDAFRAVLGGRFPDDTILSHDVIEGCILKSRLLTDVYITECPLSTLEVEMTRTHRWNRGDWQAWLYALRRNVRGDLSLLAHWKLADYARRALVPGAVFLLLIYAISDKSWANRIVGTVIALRLLQLLCGWLPPNTADLIGRSECTTARLKVRRVLAELLRELLFFACLPSLAWNTFSAAAKASWRLLYSGKYTLEWKTSAASADESSDSQGLVRNIILLTPNVTVVAFVGAYCEVAGNMIAITWFFLCLWSLGPLVSWWLSQTTSDSKQRPEGDLAI